MRIVIFLISLVISLAAPCAFGQATRTWVSGVGDDVNPCSRTAPCKTFAGAISKTAAGGEISVLDPGGYGTITITKSITINGEGTIASILHSGGINGVVISGPAAPAAPITVNLVNLSINGAGATNGLNGVRIIRAGSVSVSNTDISNYSNVGILDERTTTGTLTLTNTRIHDAIGSNPNNTSIGIRITPASGTIAPSLSCDRCTVFGHGLSNSHGIFLSSGAKATVTDSNIVGNTVGIAAGGVNAQINIVRTNVSNNGTGIRVSGSSTVRMSSATITGNTVNGIEILSGTLASFGDNYIAGNGGNNGAGLTTLPVL